MQLRVLAVLQRKVDGRALPALAGWMAEQAAPVLASWRNRTRRNALERELGGVVRTGQLTLMLALLDNPAARTADALGFKAAVEAVQRIDRLRRPGGKTTAVDRRIGLEGQRRPLGGEVRRDRSFGVIWSRHEKGPTSSSK